tara:strand:- start:601 stop:1068 length:468 start_codon:yes stop_codon:yes gene_type:complete
MIKGDNMITAIIIAALSGGLITGGSMFLIEKRQKAQAQASANIIQALETEFEKAQAQAVTNLTEPDLLRVPCSSEYIDKRGDLLCREMFCRMNRQGGGANSSGGPGAIESDCAAISAAAVNKLKIDSCMIYWDQGSGSDQNSQFWRCMSAFGSKP